jgi:type IV fimbrial biogenesis protein FimT
MNNQTSLEYRPRALNLKLAAGFSIIELIIAIAILAILVALATPSFTSIINSNRLTASGNEFLATLQYARIEAIRRNARVVVCPSNNADSASPSCSTSGTVSGWISFVDDGGTVAANARNGTLQAGERVLRVNAMPEGLELRASSNISASQRIIFRSDGLARGSAGALLEGTVSVCKQTTTPEENVREISIDSGSRMGVQKANGSGACPTPSN